VTAAPTSTPVAATPSTTGAPAVTPSLTVTPSPAPVAPASIPAAIPTPAPDVPRAAPPTATPTAPATASSKPPGPVRPSPIQSSTFESEVHITVGTTVVWTNLDGVQHTVTAMDESTDSPYLSAYETYSLTFTTPGQFQFFCRPHLQMVTTVYVSGS